MLNAHFHIYLHHLALAHAVLVNRVVYRLLDKHVYTVIRVRTVTQLTYIHTRTAPYMFTVVKMNDIVIVVLRRLHTFNNVFFRHKNRI